MRWHDGEAVCPDCGCCETLGAHLEEGFTEILRAHAKPGADLSDYAAIPWRKQSAELDAWQAYRDRLKTLRIVDLACGSGVFLIMAFNFLKAELSRVNNKIAALQGQGQHIQDLLDPDSENLTNNLFGVDVNSESVEIAKLSLGIKTARRGKVLDSLSGNLRVGDSMIEDSNFAFFKTGSSKPLRDYLRREATLEGVVNFGDLQIFEGLTTYPAILTMKRGAAPKGHQLRFWKVEALPETNFQATWEKASGPYPKAALAAGSWELENPTLRALRDKIRTGRKTLKDVYGAPCRGIVTGLNGALVIDNATKERLCAQDPRSAKLLMPAP